MTLAARAAMDLQASITDHRGNAYKNIETVALTTRKGVENLTSRALS